MAGLWPPEISIVYGLRIQLFLNKTLSGPTVLQELCMKLYFSLKLLSVFSNQLA